MLGGLVAALLAGCSPSVGDYPVTAETTHQRETITDTRLEGDTFTRAEKIELCHGTADIAEDSDVLTGQPHVDIIEDDEWFCHMDNIDWTAAEEPTGATIKLGFHEYTDEELQTLQATADNKGARLGPCELISFYTGHVTLSATGAGVAYCEQQTIVADTSYLVRNTTAITIRLELEGSPQEHSMRVLDRDPYNLREQIAAFLHEY